jgi:hypothetical protein
VGGRGASERLARPCCRMNEGRLRKVECEFGKRTRAWLVFLACRGRRWACEPGALEALWCRRYLPGIAKGPVVGLFGASWGRLARMLGGRTSCAVSFTAAGVAVAGVCALTIPSSNTDIEVI